MSNIVSLSTEIYLLPTPSATAFSSDPLASLATTASGKHQGEESQAATVVISWKMAEKFANFGYRNVRFKRSPGISCSHSAPCRAGGRVSESPPTRCNLFQSLSVLLFKTLFGLNYLR